MISSAQRLRGVSAPAWKGGGRREGGRAAAKDVGDGGEWMNMRGGAHLHIHPMACPGRGGGTGLVDMEQVTLKIQASHLFGVAKELA